MRHGSTVFSSNFVQNCLSKSRSADRLATNIMAKTSLLYLKNLSSNLLKTTSNVAGHAVHSLMKDIDSIPTDVFNEYHISPLPNK